MKHDEEYLYLKYIETEYRINRRNGAIEYATGEEWRTAENIQLL